jgi:putative hydrolase of the HAD superfamily
MYKALLLDIDNTLYPYQETHESALNAALHLLSLRTAKPISLLADVYSRAREEINRELAETASSHNRLLYFGRMTELLNLSDLSLPVDLYETYWNTFLTAMRPFEGVYEFLEFAAQKKLCIVTDLTADIQYRKLINLQLHKYASCIVTSEEAGREKPHPYIFMLALKKLHLKSCEVCMIGDSYEKDIKGAFHIGITGYWFNRTGDTRPQHEKIYSFKTFSELRDMLNE